MEKVLIVLTIIISVLAATTIGTMAYTIALHNDVADLSLKLSSLSDSVDRLNSYLENITGAPSVPKFLPVNIPIGYRLTETTIVLVKGGFLEKYAITPILIPYASGVEMRDGVIAGDIIFGEIGVMPAITAMTLVSPTEIVLLGVYESGGEKYAVVVHKDSPYQSFSDLLGKVIGIKIGSGCYSAFLRYIGLKGWKLEDFQIRDVGEAEAISALVAGSIDAVIYWEPIPSVLEEQGVARRLMTFSYEETGLHIENPIVLMAYRPWIVRNKDATIRFLAAFIEAMTFCRENTAAAAQLVFSTMKAEGVQTYSAEIYKKSMSRRSYPIYFNDYLIEDMRYVAEFLYNRGNIKSIPNIQEYIDDTYIHEAATLVEQLRK